MDNEQESNPVGCILPACQSYPMSRREGGVPPPRGPMSRGHSLPDITTPYTYPPTACIPHKRPGTKDTHHLERTWGLGYPSSGAHPQVNRMTDRHLWKHYVPATSFAGANNSYSIFTYKCGKHQKYIFAPAFAFAQCERTLVKHNNHAEWIWDLSMYVTLRLYEISTVPSCFVTSIISKIS